MSISLNKPIICPILIGRQSELTTLHALISQARSARGQLVLISGEAGIGKSRLVAEIKAWLLALERAEHLLASAPGAQEVGSQPIPALLNLKGKAAAGPPCRLPVWWTDGMRAPGGRAHRAGEVKP